MSEPGIFADSDGEERLEETLGQTDPKSEIDAIKHDDGPGLLASTWKVIKGVASDVACDK